jgi:hypothetical protein
MATCLSFEQFKVIGLNQPQSLSGKNITTWSDGEAVFESGVYTCPVGTHLLMTVAEINNMPKTGVPDAALMREHFFMSFGLVIGIWLLGKCVGAILRLFKGEESEYS